MNPKDFSKKVSKVDSSIDKVVENISKPVSKGLKKEFKKKFLKKPTAKGPISISARKTLKSFAHNTGPLVKEVEEKELVMDNRSQFFKKEVENTGGSKWLR